MQPRIGVLHEGINTERIRPDPTALHCRIRSGIDASG
jgi:hypothetical protein